MKPIKLSVILLLVAGIAAGIWLSGAVHAKSNQPAYGTVTVQALHVRSEASFSGRITGYLKQGQKVTIIKERQGWDYVEFEGKKGWASAKYIQQNQAAGRHDGTTVAVNLRLRALPNLQADVLNLLPYNSKVTILSGQNGWYYVKTAQGQEGWLSAQFVKVSAVPETVTKGEEVQNSKKSSQDSSGTAAVLTTGGVNLREAPGMSAAIVGKSEKGSRFTYLGREGGWIHVEQESGKQAWVAADYVSLTTSSPQPAAKKEDKHIKPGLKGKTIVIDPGHGGKDHGTTGPGDHMEKTSTFSTALIVKQKLEQSGAHVVMTRTSDRFIPLSERTHISNSDNADAYISIHYNSESTGTSKGIMSFYYQQQKDKQLAKSVQSSVIKETGLTNRGVHFGNLFVLRNNNQPCMLIELGFLSNKQEEKKVITKSYQEKAAEGIADGLKEYFGG